MFVKFSSSGSMKKIPSNFSGIIELWFADCTFLLLLRIDASDICFHISGHASSGLEVVCFVSLLPHVYLRIIIAHVNKRYQTPRCSCGCAALRSAYDDCSTLNVFMAPTHQRSDAHLEACNTCTVLSTLKATPVAWHSELAVRCGARTQT